MSSETPAAHLARLKVEHPGWIIWSGNQTLECWAMPPADYLVQDLLSAGDPAELEILIREADDTKRMMR